MVHFRFSTLSVMIVGLLSVLIMPSVQGDEPSTPRTASSLIQDLQNEKDKQIKWLNEQQRVIRANSAQRDFGNKQKNKHEQREHIELLILRAKRAFIEERMKNLDSIPHAVLIQWDPEWNKLKTEAETLQRQKEAMAALIRDPAADPRIQQIDQHLKEIDSKINIQGDADDKQRQVLLERLRKQEELNLFHIDQQIRQQEILVEMLTKQYVEQVRKNADQTKRVLEDSFEHDQLERTKKILDQIEKRILALQSADTGAVEETDDSMNARLTRIELLLRSIQRDQQIIKSTLQRMKPANADEKEDKSAEFQFHYLNTSAFRR